MLLQCSLLRMPMERPGIIPTPLTDFLHVPEMKILVRSNIC